MWWEPNDSVLKRKLVVLLIAAVSVVGIGLPAEGDWIVEKVADLGDADPFPDYISPDMFTAAGDHLFFRSYDFRIDPTPGLFMQFWFSDGTEAGTAPLHDFPIDFAGNHEPYLPAYRIMAEDTLFFSIDETGYDLWTSDGTASGTVPVTAYGPSDTNGAHWLTAVDNTMFFVLATSYLVEPYSALDLWRSDGTDAGTIPVRSIEPERDYDEVRELTAVGDRLFFLGVAMGSYDDLWVSDGTEAGTIPVLAGVDLPGEWGPSSPVCVGNYLYCWTSTSTTASLWKSDGTPEGTVRVREIPSQSYWYHEAQAAVGNLLFFSMAQDGDATGEELWRSDGTFEGTVLVKDIRPGEESSYPSSFMAAGGLLFFTADDGTHGRELWRSDGTEAGTFMVKELYTGSDEYPDIHLMAGYEGSLVFAVESYESFRPLLWISDGTEEGTQLLCDAGVFDGLLIDGATCAQVDGEKKVYFRVTDYNDAQLWVAYEEAPDPLDVSQDTPSTLYATEGQAVTFQVTVGDTTGQVTYQWYKVGADKTNVPVGTNAPALHINPVFYRDHGEYYCEVTDAVSSGTSPMFTLEVDAAAPALANLMLLVLMGVVAMGGTALLRRRRA